MKILKKNTPLTVKQKKYVRRVAETGAIWKSATDVGFKQPGYGSQLMQNPKILTAIQVELDNMGATADVIARKIRKGFDATRVIKDEGKKYPDFHAQHKFLDMALKIRGDYAPEKHEIRQETLTLIVTPETIKGLEDAEAITKAEVKILTTEATKEKKKDVERK